MSFTHDWPTTGWHSARVRRSLDPIYAPVSFGPRFPAGWWLPARTTPERVAHDTEPPGWTRDVERAFFGGVRTAGDRRVTGSWTDDFALVLSPLIEDAASRLDGELRELPVGVADRGALRAGFVTDLSRRLVGLATPVLVHQLHEDRDRGRLNGVDGRARFADFVRQHLARDRLAGLLTGYPVLVRLMARECATSVESLTELLRRFAADRDRLTDLLGGTEPAAVVEVRGGRGDRHQGGRATSVVLLADGARLVYKPRGVDAHLRFTDLVGAVNALVPGLGLDTVAAVAVDGAPYGWTAHVAPAPLAAAAQSAVFYRRAGALLALLHIVRATDIHYDNVVARGDQPLVVDVETLFHPRPGATDLDPAGAALANSVARTAMLPAVAGRHGLTDVSAVGGDPGQQTGTGTTCWLHTGTDEMRRGTRPGAVRGAANRPHLGDLPLDPADHVPAMLTGFSEVYDAVARHRDEFAAVLRGCAGTTVRVVPRPTREYAAMLAGAGRPELLRDARARERALRPADPVARPDGDTAPWTEHELADLWDGDIPLFTTRCDSRHLWTATATCLPDVFDRSGLEEALAGLAELNELDRRDQQWIIAASLASRRPAGGQLDPAPASVATTAVGTDQLLSAACSIGDRVVSAVIGGERVNWLGVEPVADTRWLVLPMGAGLANGYTGVALFLAELSRISGVPRYREVARRSLAAVPELLRGLSDRPDHVEAVGAGGLHGFGGIGYALARLASLLDDTEVARWAGTTVPLAARAVAANDDVDWANGVAGCAAAMSAVDAELGCPPARELAEHCAHLLATAPRPDTPGFAEGIAGMDHALVVVTGESPPSAGPPAAPPVGPGWYQGTAGAVLGTRDRTPDRAIAAVADHPVLSDLTLCHGELGRTDVLAALDSLAGNGPAADILRHRSGMVMDVLRRDGPRCATPNGVATPGLLSGLAGIGYGLLRIGFPRRVPSALLLEPSPQA